MTERAIERAQGIVQIAQHTSSTSVEEDQKPASEQLHRPPPSKLIHRSSELGRAEQLVEQRAQIRTAAQAQLQRRLEAEATDTVVTAVDAVVEEAMVEAEAAEVAMEAVQVMKVKEADELKEAGEEEEAEASSNAKLSRLQRLRSSPPARHRSPQLRRAKAFPSAARAELSRAEEAVAVTETEEAKLVVEAEAETVTETKVEVKAVAVEAEVVETEAVVEKVEAAEAAEAVAEDGGTIVQVHGEAGGGGTGDFHVLVA